MPVNQPVRNRGTCCMHSPLQLEIDHSPLEEANSHAGVLGHCLVKCLGTKMLVEQHAQ